MSLELDDYLSIYRNERENYYSLIRNLTNRVAALERATLQRPNDERMAKLGEHLNPPWPTVFQLWDALGGQYKTGAVARVWHEAAEPLTIRINDVASALAKLRATVTT